MKEIELKAHVEPGRVEQVKLHFTCQYGPCVNVSKKDYYIRESGGGKFRIRQENEQYFLTRKKKSLDKNGIECNIESEQVIDKNSADAILKKEKPFFTKTKTGFIWHTKYLDYCANVELLDVDTLGWFLEIEVLLPEDSAQEAVENAKNWLMSRFVDVDLEKFIEKRKYMEMLKK